jgi:hypothetical protein
MISAIDARLNTKAVDRALQTQADRLCSLVPRGVEMLPALTQGFTATQGWSTMSMIDKRETNEDSSKSSAYSEGRYS